MDVPCFIKEHLWTSACIATTLKKNFGGSKPSSELTLKTKWYHSCSYSDDSWNCEEIKKHVTNKYYFLKS